MLGDSQYEDFPDRFRACAGIMALGGIGSLMTGTAAAQRPSDGADLLHAMHDRYVGKWYHTLTFTQATTRRTPADTLVHETWYESMRRRAGLRIDIGGQTAATSYVRTRQRFPQTRRRAPVIRRPGRNPLLILGFDVYTQPVEKTVSVHSRGRDRSFQDPRGYVAGPSCLRRRRGRWRFDVQAVLGRCR